MRSLFVQYSTSTGTTCGSVQVAGGSTGSTAFLWDLNEHFLRKMSCCYAYFLNKSIAIVVSGKMLLWSYWLLQPKDSPVRNTRNWMAMWQHLWMYWLSGRDTVRPVTNFSNFRCPCAIRRVCINFSYICWTLIGFLARTPTHTFSQRASAAPVRVPRFL